MNSGDTQTNSRVAKSLDSVDKLLYILSLGHVVTWRWGANYDVTDAPELHTFLILLRMAVTYVMIWHTQFGKKMTDWTKASAFAFLCAGVRIHAEDWQKTQAYVEQLQPEEQITHVYLGLFVIFLCSAHYVIGEDVKYFCFATMIFVVDFHVSYEKVSILPSAHMVQSVAMGLIWLDNYREGARHTKMLLTIFIAAGMGAVGSSVLSLLQPDDYTTLTCFVHITLNGMTTRFAIFLTRQVGEE